MKKIVYMFTICSALLLFGCSEDKASEETEPPIQSIEVNKTENTTDKNLPDNEKQTSADSQNLESKGKETVITPEKAEEVVQEITKIAQEDQVINTVEIDDSRDEIIVNIIYHEDTDDDERGVFLLNYIFYLKKQYPDQEFKINIEK